MSVIHKALQKNIQAPTIKVVKVTKKSKHKMIIIDVSLIFVILVLTIAAVTFYYPISIKQHWAQAKSFLNTHTFYWADLKFKKKSEPIIAKEELAQNTAIADSSSANNDSYSPNSQNQVFI